MNYSYFSYTRVIAVVALFAGAILLWPGKLYFLNDDFLHLQLTSEGKWLQQNSFRPICDLSMWIDYQLWGLNAVGYHVTNTLLHIICAILAFRFSNQLLVKYHQAAVASSNAILIAAIFFVYGFHSETIYWIIGRSASLGAFWFLLSLTCYMNRHSAKGHLFFILFFILGLFTYESVWIAPAVFLVLSWLEVKQGGSTWSREARYIVTPLVALVLYLLIRYLFIQQVVASYEADKFLRLDLRGLATNYLKLLLRSFSRQSGDFYLLGIAFLMGVTAVISFLITRRRQLALALVLIWLASYLPYLSLGIDTFGSEGERFLYLPSIFLAIITGIGMVNAARVYKYIISLLYFFVHILLLYEGRKAYELASNVTHSTVVAIKLLEGAKTIYFVQLPEENNGALIFRQGSEAAVKLFHKNQAAAKTISTFPGNYSFFTGVNEQPWVDGLPGNPATDVVLDFSNSSLTIYR